MVSEEANIFLNDKMSTKPDIGVHLAEAKEDSVQASDANSEYSEELGLDYDRIDFSQEEIDQVIGWDSDAECDRIVREWYQESTVEDIESTEDDEEEEESNIGRQTSKKDDEDWFEPPQPRRRRSTTKKSTQRVVTRSTKKPPEASKASTISTASQSSQDRSKSKKKKTRSTVSYPSNRSNTVLTTSSSRVNDDALIEKKKNKRRRAIISSSNSSEDDEPLIRKTTVATPSIPPTVTTSPAEPSSTNVRKESLTATSNEENQSISNASAILSIGDNTPAEATRVKLEPVSENEAIIEPKSTMQRKLIFLKDEPVDELIDIKNVPKIPSTTNQNKTNQSISADVQEAPPPDPSAKTPVRRSTSSASVNKNRESRKRQPPVEINSYLPSCVEELFATKLSTTTVSSFKVPKKKNTEDTTTPSSSQSSLASSSSSSVTVLRPPSLPSTTPWKSIDDTKQQEGRRTTVCQPPVKKPVPLLRTPIDREDVVFNSNVPEARWPSIRNAAIPENIDQSTIYSMPSTVDARPPRSFTRWNNDDKSSPSSCQIKPLFNTVTRHPAVETSLNSPSSPVRKATVDGVLRVGPPPKVIPLEQTDCYVDMRKVIQYRLIPIDPECLPKLLKRISLPLPVHSVSDSSIDIPHPTVIPSFVVVAGPLPTEVDHEQLKALFAADNDVSIKFVRAPATADTVANENRSMIALLCSTHEKQESLLKQQSINVDGTNISIGKPIQVTVNLELIDNLVNEEIDMENMGRMITDELETHFGPLVELLPLQRHPNHIITLARFQYEVHGTRATNVAPITISNYGRLISSECPPHLRTLWPVIGNPSTSASVSAHRIHPTALDPSAPDASASESGSRVVAASPSLAIPPPTLIDPVLLQSLIDKKRALMQHADVNSNSTTVHPDVKPEICQPAFGNSNSTTVHPDMKSEMWHPAFGSTDTPLDVKPPLPPFPPPTALSKIKPPLPTIPPPTLLPLPYPKVVLPPPGLVIPSAPIKKPLLATPSTVSKSNESIIDRFFFSDRPGRIWRSPNDSGMFKDELSTEVVVPSRMKEDTDCSQFSDVMLFARPNDTKTTANVDWTAVTEYFKDVKCSICIYGGEASMHFIGSNARERAQLVLLNSPHFIGDRSFVVGISHAVLFEASHALSKITLYEHLQGKFGSVVDVVKQRDNFNCRPLYKVYFEEEDKARKAMKEGLTVGTITLKSI